jgi:hypothetical protein
MEEEKKVREETGGKGWFPFTEKQEKDRSTVVFHPSFAGQGYEQVQLRRPDLWGDISHGGVAGIDTMQTRDVIRFLYEKFEFAASEGKLPEVYDHYVDQVKKAGIFSGTVEKTLDDYKSDVHKARGWKGQQECVEQLREYFKTIKMEKRE